jgi:hypothetical protein
MPPKKGNGAAHHRQRDRTCQGFSLGALAEGAHNDAPKRVTTLAGVAAVIVKLGAFTRKKLPTRRYQIIRYRVFSFLFERSNTQVVDHSLLSERPTIPEQVGSY